MGSPRFFTGKIKYRKVGKIMECYLDNSATTKCFDSVATIMTQVMCQDYEGNPSSMHMKEVQAEQYLRYAKDVITRILKVNERDFLHLGRYGIG